MPEPQTLQYYRTPGVITTLTKYKEFLEWLTDDIRAIVQVVQGLIVHDLWLERYGTALRKEQCCDVNIAYMEDLLDKAMSLDNRSLAISRPPEKRVIACCREFATLVCAILRHKGIPARSRCGFSTYLALPGYFEDHWICEYWHVQEHRWVKVDSQIDPFQQSFIAMRGNPLDLTPSEFLVAGEAWKTCRQQQADPEKFGIACDPEHFGLDTLYGLWFIRGNLLRDFAALNKIETVPFLAWVAKHLTWDSWRLVAAKDEELSEHDYALLDSIAEFSCDPDVSFEQLQEFYQSHPDLQPPQNIIART